MPTINIELKNGTAKAVNFDRMPSDDDIEEVANHLNDTVLQGSVKKEYTQNWDNKGRVYYTDEYGNKVENESLSGFEKLGRKIKATGANIHNWIEEQNPNSETYKQKANLILAAATLPIGAGAKATQAGANFLRPYFGKAISKGIAQGAGAGVVGGGIEGFGRGFIEDENPITTGLQGAIIGGFGGGLLGGGLAKGVKIYRGGKLKNHKPLEDMTKKEYMEYRKQAKDYYNKYLNETNINNKLIGDIKFPNSQAGKTAVFNMEQYPNLKKQIKGAKNNHITNNKNRKDALFFNNLENTYNGKNYNYQIRKNSNDKTNDFYMIKEINNKTSSPAYSEQPRALNEDVNNIIADNNRNLNLSESAINKQASKLAQNAELPSEIKQSIFDNSPEYEVLHNKDLIIKAQKAISQDINGRRVRLEDLADKELPLSAQDFEEARQLVGQLYKEGRIDEAIKLTEKISVAGSKAGQAVQAMSLWSKTTPEGAIRQAQKIINDYNKTARKKLPELSEEQAKNIIELAEDVQYFNGKINSGNIDINHREKDIATAKLLKHLGELVPQSTGNKLKTLRNISLLLNGKTFARNITGNAIFSGMENMVTKPVAAGIDRIASLVTNKRTRVMPQSAKYWQGLKQGLREGMEDVNLGIDTRKGIGQRFDLPQRRSFNGPILGRLEKALDYSLRVPDRAFYQATFNESLANQMKAAGVKEATEEMVNHANLEALESVYQNNGQIASIVSDIRKGFNKAGIKDFGLGDALMPYVQTPANVAQQGINYSPLGFANAIKSGIKGNRRQATLDAARALVGSGIIGAGYKGAKNSLFTDNIEDYQIRKNNEALGIRPNQINLPNGSVMSYSQLQPLAAPLATGAILKDIEGGNYVQALDKGIGTLADMSMLRGLDNFSKDYREDGLATALTNTVTAVPGQFIGTAINHFNGYIDPYQREIYDPNPLMRGINQIRAKTPILSKTLPYKYDVRGKQIEKYQSKGIERVFDTFINPVFKNKVQDDVVLKEINALYEISKEKDAFLPIPEKKIKLDNGKSKVLNNRGFALYSKKLGETTYKNYQTVMNTQFYLDSDDNTRKKILADVKENSKTIVQEELFGNINKNIMGNKYKKFNMNPANKIRRQTVRRTLY